MPDSSVFIFFDTSSVGKQKYYFRNVPIKAIHPDTLADINYFDFFGPCSVKCKVKKGFQTKCYLNFAMHPQSFSSGRITKFTLKRNRNGQLRMLLPLGVSGTSTECDYLVYEKVGPLTKALNDSLKRVYVVSDLYE